MPDAQRICRLIGKASLWFLLFPGPPLVILEFVPHGDLLGYLKKSQGENDDYYNLRNKESTPSKITKQQLYQFARDIACGMEFISAHQVCLQKHYRMLRLKQQFLKNELIRHEYLKEMYLSA